MISVFYLFINNSIDAHEFLLRSIEKGVSLCMSCGVRLRARDQLFSLYRRSPHLNVNFRYSHCNVKSSL